MTFMVLYEKGPLFDAYNPHIHADPNDLQNPMYNVNIEQILPARVAYSGSYLVTK